MVGLTTSMTLHMIHAEYEGNTLRQAQLAKVLAERFSATPDTCTEQQRHDRARKSIIEPLKASSTLSLPERPSAPAPGPVHGSPMMWPAQARGPGRRLGPILPNVGT